MGSFGIIFSISSVFPASQIARIARRPAAGATNTASIPAIQVKYGPTRSTFVKKGALAPIPTNISAAMRNVGTLSCVIFPTAKNDSIPTTNHNADRSVLIVPE